MTFLNRSDSFGAAIGAQQQCRLLDPVGCHSSLIDLLPLPGEPAEGIATGRVVPVLGLRR